MSMRISHEAIYRYLYVLPRGSLKQTLIKALRQEHKYRRKREHAKIQGNRGKIADMLSIEERPREVADRSVPGHWEGDIILGKHRKSGLGTLVERTTRYTILVPLGKNKGAAAVRQAYAPPPKICTLILGIMGMERRIIYAQRTPPRQPGS